MIPERAELRKKISNSTLLRYSISVAYNNLQPLMSATPVLLKARADGRVSALSNAVKMFPSDIVVLMERDE